MSKLTALAFIASLPVFMASGTEADAKNTSFKISCNTARHMIQERGYKPVTVKSCISTVYSFYAVRKGRTYIFHVDSRTRFIWQG
jgi:hypothetical protein